MQKNEKISDIMKHTLYSLICVARTKTTDDYAWSTLKKLINELKDNYSFLNYVNINDLENLKNNIEDIQIISKIENIESREIGKSIQDLIDLYKKYLGKKAGYFFIREFKNDLGEKYHSSIKSLGVDLRLIELQNEMKGIESSKYEIKEESKSNIAFIKKQE